MVLTGARILVTRPAHQAQALCALIEQAGGSALRLPLFRIVASAADAELAARLAAAMNADWWLFTSTNAVHVAAALSPRPWPSGIAAVGAATAAALRSIGLADVQVPGANYSGAALLELEPFRAPQGLRCRVITGEQGRTELAETLSARGAQVETLALYRREAIAYQSDVAAVLIDSADAIVLTSAEAVGRLLELAPAMSSGTLLDKAVLVPSPRVAEKVRESGFTVPPLLPQQIDDSAMVDALADWWRTRKPAP
jgi:uroporphyrinogen-III synthase